MLISRTAALAVLCLASCFAPADVSAQSTFDCRRPRSETVAIVCRDPNLSALDQQIDRAYRTALDQAAEPNRVRDNHAAWANGLSACGGDRQCIGQALDEQLTALEYAATTGRHASELAVDVAEPEPFYGPAPPLEPRSAVASSDLAVEAAPPEFTSQEPTVDEGTVAVAEIVASENADTEGERVVGATTPSASINGSENRPSGISQMIGGGLILGLIVAVLAALLATKALADRTSRRFGWPMILNWWNVLHLVAGFALWAGAAMGSLIGGVVVAGGIWLIVLAVNIRKTDVLTGVAISVVQPFVVAILFVVFQLSRSKPKPYNYISRS